MARAQDIFLSHNLYPFTGKIKDHFAGIYEEVMIVFLPFYNEQLEKDVNVEEIVQSVKVVPWEAVRRGAGFKELSELYKALKISIGSLQPAFAQPDVALQLNDYIEVQRIQAPIAGAYDIFTKVAIYKTFEILGKHRIVVTDEFYESTYTLELNELDAMGFSEKIAADAYYIYPEDKSFLFTMGWDSFFFLFACGKQEMTIIQEKKLFDGFLCDEDTVHHWYLKKDELESFFCK